MKHFLFIFSNNIAPILLIIFVGYMVNKIFEFDVDSFVKINFYIS